MSNFLNRSTVGRSVMNKVDNIVDLINRFLKNMGDDKIKIEDIEEVDAVRYYGDGSGLTGIGTGTGGVINEGSTTIGADSNDDGTGEIALQTKGVTRVRVKNDGTLEVLTNAEFGGNVVFSEYLSVPYLTPLSDINDTTQDNTMVSMTRIITESEKTNVYGSANEPRYISGPAHGQGSGALYGAALAPNGKIIFSPFNSPNVGIYDPVANTYTDGPAHGQGSNAFFGAALAPNGKIIFSPFNSPNVGIYDPVANTYTDGPEHGEGSGAFIGATLAPNGKIIFAPRASANVGIYDPVAKTYTDGPAHGQGSGAFTGAALAPNGKIILAPTDSANVGIYDPVANTYTDGPAHGQGSGAFRGAALAPNGKIIFSPTDSANVGIYDPVANTYTDGPEHGEGSGAFIGATLAPNGKIIFASRGSANVGIYDPQTQIIGKENTAMHPLINNGL